jgi:hypothetical protein
MKAEMEKVQNGPQGLLLGLKHPQISTLPFMLFNSAISNPLSFYLIQ